MLSSTWPFIVTILTSMVLPSANDDDSQVVPTPVYSMPPPPLPTYDPVAGPFLALIGKDGEFNDPGVATNALKQWGGPKLAAFYLCFQPVSKLIDWTRVLRGLDNVSRELAAQGAAVVVIDDDRICDTSRNAHMSANPYVEIRGVIRSID